jgi:hypothetical protein
MRDLDAIRNVVLSTLEEDFDHIRILDVDINEDVDIDGDEVLRIDVIFEGAPKNLDARKLSGAVRHLKPKLYEIKEFAMPLLSFISQADLRRKRATA